MAEGKKTFIFYSDWINMVREMPDKDAGALLKHILSYVNDENPQTDNLLVKMAFGHMKPMLKCDLDKWEVIRTKRKIAGKKGGQANAKQNEANAKQVEAVNDNDNVNDNVNDNENNNKVVPTYDLFLSHAKQKAQTKNIILDEKKVKQKFESWLENGWKDLNERPIKNWKVKITSNLLYWEKNKSVLTDDGTKRNNYLKDVL
jgi:hypothetical protein